MNYKVQIVTGVTLLLVFMGALAAEAKVNTEPFDLVKKRVNGQMQVCKVEYEDGVKQTEDKVCYPSVEEFPDSLDIVSQVKERLKRSGEDMKALTIGDIEAVGGSLLLKPSVLDTVVDNYDSLKVKNFALSELEVSSNDDYIMVPFFASLHWRGKNWMEGTLNTSGIISIPRTYLDQMSLASERLPVYASFDAFSDSKTEQQIHWMRYVETSARYIHFSSIDGLGTDVNEKTLALLNEVVGPVIVGEVFYVPLYGQFVKSAEGEVGLGDLKP